MARRRGGNGPGPGAAVADLDAAEERLYGAALDEFVSMRGELAKELRAGGDAAAARALAGRRKPSVALWAVNQLPRRFGAEVDVLLAAGEALRAAQAGDPKGFAGVVATERRLVAALTDRSAVILEEGGHAASESNLERVRRILQAASAASDEERERLRRGMLAEELEPTGFARAFAVLGLEAEEGRAPARGAPKRGEQVGKGTGRGGAKGRGATTDRRAVAAGSSEAGERAALRRAALAEAREAERQLREVQAEAAAVARGLDLQQRHLEMAEEDLKRSHGAVTDAEQALVAARERVTKAAETRDALRRTVQEAQRRHDEGRAALAAAKAEAARRQAVAASLKAVPRG